MTAYWFQLPGFRPGLGISTFNVVDGFNRQALETELDMNLPAPGIILIYPIIGGHRVKRQSRSTEALLCPARNGTAPPR